MKRALCLLLPVLLLAGCERNMYEQPRYQPYQPSPFFKDGRSERTPPPHTVAQGELRDDRLLYEGRNADGTLATVFPFPVTAAVLARGHEQYQIFCAVCHGSDGSGNGMVVERGFPAPPSYHTDRLRRAPVGHFFDVITHGYGVMYPYNARVAPEDRWAIAAYIRALQLSHHATPEDVPPDQRPALEAAP